MRVLLVSCYELGHQPLHVASPAQRLADAGHDVRCLDLSLEKWDPDLVDQADAVAFSVPMHTAMRIALRAAASVRKRRPGLPTCFYGLYAAVNHDLTVGSLADRLIAGEYEEALLDWLSDLSGLQRTGSTSTAGPVRIELARGSFSLPRRHLLPPLSRYAHLAIGDEQRLVGYVEASHGCAHRCRHCPVPMVYDGRIRIVDTDLVLEDIAQLVEMGARHITFGDPDFLNGPRHSMRVIEAFHHRFPNLTFDCTVKVEHILRYPAIWGEMAAQGCLFVVTAIECLNDEILARLDKGHTATQAAEAIKVLRGHEIEPRPSFLPFTPWTTLRDVADIFDFVADNDLVPNVDPVQYSIRLLIPDGSLLLAHLDDTPNIGPYDPEILSYAWSSIDPELDVLQQHLAAIAEKAARAAEPVAATYLRARQATYAALGGGTSGSGASPVPHLDRAGQASDIPGGTMHGSLATGFLTSGSSLHRPRLTEPWFC